jgi:CRISPR/Cas system-associated exonuclease Cas4 (RecB family)
MDNMSAHIVGLNPINKKIFLSNIKHLLNKINIIDLDEINQIILKDNELDLLFKQFNKFKQDRNDKYKEFEKKMSNYWETKFIDLVQNKISNNFNLLIGQNNHYRSLSRKIPIECSNKFIINTNLDEEISQTITYYLDNYKQDIINGNLPLQYLDRNWQKKRRLNLELTYKKNGYIAKTIIEIKNLLENISTKKNNQTNFYRT